MPKISISGFIIEYKPTPGDESVYMFNSSKIDTKDFSTMCKHTIEKNVEVQDPAPAKVAAIDAEISKINAEAGEKITELKRQKQSWLAITNTKA